MIALEVNNANENRKIKAEEEKVRQELQKEGEFNEEKKIPDSKKSTPIVIEVSEVKEKNVSEKKIVDKLSKLNFQIVRILLFLLNHMAIKVDETIEGHVVVCSLHQLTGVQQLRVAFLRRYHHTLLLS